MISYELLSASVTSPFLFSHFICLLSLYFPSWTGFSNTVSSVLFKISPLKVIWELSETQEEINDVYQWLSTSGDLVMSGDISGHHSQGEGATGI